jgi:hypothetical protein
MSGSTNFDVGVAGSLTMIFLVIAIIILLRSFFRHYKKAAGPTFRDISRKNDSDSEDTQD